jgi:enoyl-CoA hydratase/carnithine racemase
MGFIRVSVEDHVACLELGRGKANALNGELVLELEDALERAAGEAEVRALVLASALPRVFCAGFDAAEVFAYERPAMLAFFTRFVRLFERLRTLPKPVVCALEGHAFAGGAILALAADFRLMAESATLSVNEVDLAVCLPASMIHALALTASPELARSMLLGAEVVSAPRALAGGLVSQVLPASEVRAAALLRARALGEKPALAFAVHKRALDPYRGEALPDAEIAATIDSWFGTEASLRRQALQQRLAAKTKPKA